MIHVIQNHMRVVYYFFLEVKIFSTLFHLVLGLYNAF